MIFSHGSNQLGNHSKHVMKIKLDLPDPSCPSQEERLSLQYAFVTGYECGHR
jgi:hypothetical protein